MDEEKSLQEKVREYIDSGQFAADFKAAAEKARASYAEQEEQSRIRREVWRKLHPNPWDERLGVAHG